MTDKRLCQPIFRKCGRQKMLSVTNGRQSGSDASGMAIAPPRRASAPVRTCRPSMHKGCRSSPRALRGGVEHPGTGPSDERRAHQKPSATSTGSETPAAWSRTTVRFSPAIRRRCAPASRRAAPPRPSALVTVMAVSRMPPECRGRSGRRRRFAEPALGRRVPPLTAPQSQRHA